MYSVKFAADSSVFNRQQSPWRWSLSSRTVSSHYSTRLTVNNSVFFEHQVPSGFAGEPTDPGKFVAVQSGPFNNVSTWSEGIVPYGACSVTIPTGVQVTLARAILDLNLTLCEVYGSLILGSSSGRSFAFLYSPSIILYPSGTLEDRTAGNEIYLPGDSIITMYPDASFVGTNTSVLTNYSASRAIASDNARVLIGSKFSGPFTAGIVPGRSVQTFKRAECMVRSSGSFTEGRTWLGRAAPSNTFCAAVRGCGLSIVSGFTLSTASLNGELNMNFVSITVAAGASFQLGTPGSSAGFRFRFKASIDIAGTLEDATGGTGGIFLPFGTNLNFLASARFVSRVATSLHVYDPDTGLNVGQATTLNVSFTGPYFVAVSATGGVAISNQGNLFDPFGRLTTNSLCFSTGNGRCRIHTNCFPSCQVWLVQG